MEGKGEKQTDDFFGILLEANTRAEIYLKDWQSELKVGKKLLPGRPPKHRGGRGYPHPSPCAGALVRAG